LRRRKELAPVALPGLRRQLPMMMGLAGMAGLVAWGIGRGLDGEAVALQARLVLVFVPLLGAGAVYWAMSGLVGVDSAKAILGILRRPRRK
jgi:purine nucleoside permease